MSAILLGPGWAGAEQVVFSEVMYHPAGAAPEFVEMWNLTTTPLDIAKWRFADGVTYEFPDFSAAAPQAHILQSGERVVVSALGEAATRAAYPAIPAGVRVFGPWTGSLDNSGETIRLEDKNGVAVCELSYKPGGNWPKAADGTGHSLVLKSENNEFDNFRNWRQSQTAGGTPGYAEFSAVEPYPGNPETGAGSSAVLFDYGTVWKWNLPASDPGTAWRGAAFDDASWQSGPGLLGFETAGLPAPGLQTAAGSSGQSMVYLFRKTFTFSGNPAGALFAIDQVIDDGVVYYLNGQLLGSVGHNPGAWDAAASRTVGDATEEVDAVTGAAAGLVNGVNVLAAEVHQTNLTSSDMVFGARLRISTQDDLIINEVKPGAAGQGFVEFYNTSTVPTNLQNHYLSDDPGNLTKFLISSSLPVPARGFATVGFAESGLAVGPVTRVYLTAPGGTVVRSAISADIPLDGRSLSRRPAGSSAWFLNVQPTPGGPAANGSDAFTLRLSEVHFDADGAVDWVELENTDSSPAETDGLFLASRTDFADKIPLTGNMPGSGFASWTVNFPVPDSGDFNLWLIDSAGNVLGTAELKRAAGRDSLFALWPRVVLTKPSWQHVPDRARWYSSGTATRDAANPPAPDSGVVINEIMPDPPSDQRNGEFLELYNKTGQQMNLSGWKLRGGVDFDFASGTSIPAGGYLVVGADPGWLRSVYPSASVAGPWSGKLGNKGDLLRLIDGEGNPADEVDYQVGGDWPGMAAGQGSSLELIHPDMDNNRPSAWRASVEADKTGWQTYTVTGTWAQLTTQGSASDYKELHLFLVGDSHVALRDFSLTRNNTGANLLPGNGTGFSTDGTAVNGWLCQGTHADSFMDNGELHLVADGHGDNRPNRAELDVTALTQGSSYTLTFQARWLSGKNRLIVQTWDHSFGASLLLPVPDALGSAGVVNTVRAATPAPQVDTVVHRPAVPGPSDPVRITARITSVSPLASVEVRHRGDDAATPGAWSGTPMTDDGTGGDSVANDGLYTATLTNYQTEGRVVQFYVRATSAAGGVDELPRGGAARPALWIVDSRSMDARLRRQRFVVSEYERGIFNTGGDAPSANYGYRYPRLSNHYINATFISNESDVYYNAEIRKSGSPWTRSSDGSLDRGKWKVPRDRLYRGREKSTFDNDAAGGSRHHNRLVRYWLYVLGHPANESEFVQHVVNRGGPAIREDTEPVDGEFVSRAFPDGGNGQLFRSDDEWWFTDDWGRNSRNADWSWKGTSNPLRYHTEWMTRSREAEHDYSALTDFFRTVSNNPALPDATYRERTERMMDSRLILMMAAVRGYINDWDSLTLDRGKNGFFYRKPDDGKFIFLHWDSDLGFSNSSSTVVGGLAGWGTYIGKPWARRTLNYYLSEMLRITSGSGSARTAAWLDAEETASSAWTVDRSFYNNWFSSRGARVTQEINSSVGSGGAGGAASAAFAVSTPSGNTAAATLTLDGTAPATAATVTVDGHPEAVLTWSNQTTWKLTGIVLKQGSNALTLRMLDENGDTVGTPTVFNQTKSNNAEPAMQLTTSPASSHVALGQSLTLNAGASVDPEGTPLDYAWSWTPGTGVTVLGEVPYLRTASFRVPGLYRFTVTGTDQAAPAVSSSLTREVTVYSTADFDAFGDLTLSGRWTPQAVSPRGSYAPSAWYSLEDKPGKLLLQVREDAPHPLVFDNPGYPALFRALPQAGDFVFKTKFDYDAQWTGSAFAGITVETEEGGVPVKYAFGVDQGANWRVRRSTGGAFANTGSSPAFTGTGAVLRVRRAGDELLFECEQGGSWTVVLTQSLPAGAKVIRGGIFLATTAAENSRMAFDYTLLADPGSTNSQLNNLRITEVMYAPKAPATAEWIEIRNTGTGPVSLLGVRFPQGAPVDELVLPDVSLGAGQYAIVTSDSTAFRTGYGMGPLIAAQWTGGALNNGGEAIRMLDADGNTIHEFAYDDAAPWPDVRETGPGLEIIDPEGNYSDPANWRASDGPSGSPGSGGLGPDTDGDGMADRAEEWFGTDPLNPDSLPVATVTGAGALSFPSVAGHDYQILFSPDLSPGSWTVLATVRADSEITTFVDPTDAAPARRFYRVGAVLP